MLVFLMALVFLFIGYMLIQLGLQRQTRTRIWGYAIVAAGATSLLAGITMLFG